MMAEPGPGRRVARRDLVCLGGFLVFWIVPMTYHGLSGSKKMPGLPDGMLHLTNVSCLFTRTTTDWPSEYIEIQPAPGVPWVEVPEGDYFRMKVFGHRTKLNNIAMRKLPAAAFAEAAAYVRKRYVELHPREPAPFVVRFVVAAPPVVGMAHPGSWRTPPLATVPISERRVWYTGIFPDALQGGRPPTP
jgi:hypothetical protein